MVGLKFFLIYVFCFLNKENSEEINYKYDLITFGTKKAMFYLRKNEIDLSIELKSENKKLVVITIQNEKCHLEIKTQFFPTKLEIENGMWEKEDGDLELRLLPKTFC